MVIIIPSRYTTIIKKYTKTTLLSHCRTIYAPITISIVCGYMLVLYPRKCRDTIPTFTNTSTLQPPYSRFSPFSIRIALTLNAMLRKYHFCVPLFAVHRSLIVRYILEKLEMEMVTVLV